MYQIIMVCTGNICRSPMAAGLARFLLPRHLQQRVAVTSAGVSALHGNPAQPLAVEVMSGMGIDIGTHRARQMTSDLARGADLVLTMEIMQRDLVRRMLLWKKAKVRLLTDFNPQSNTAEIADPYGGPLAAYQACLENLRPHIGHLMDWLDTQDDILSSPQVD